MMGTTGESSKQMRHPIIVAGHLCLDIAPDLSERHGEFSKSIEPGKLINTGPAHIGPGGCVANTGLAAVQLRETVRLLGKIGDDGFGDAIRRALYARAEGLDEWLHVSKGEASSYTLVFDPPDEDRMFFHYPGVNDTFSPEDVKAVFEQQKGAAAGIFHFGYPPLMRGMRNAADLEAMFARVRELGYTTSLDMAWPDPGSDAGRTDWRSLLAQVLPQVDLFLPSIDEIIMMLYPEGFHELLSRAGKEVSILRDLAHELLEMGAAAVGLKLGANGMYLRTSSNQDRVSHTGTALSAHADMWCEREVLCPVFPVNVVATTGAGDCTIAGLLSAVSRGKSPEEAVKFAVATGALSVESEDPTSGIVAAEEIETRMAGGWLPGHTAIETTGWRKSSESGICFGPSDRYGPSSAGKNS